jgi:hypothetical protein
MFPSFTALSVRKNLNLGFLQLCLEHFENEFIEIATKLSAVVACRCSPTQKADVARLIRRHTRRRVCCIGDGGNDVSMIQAADVGESMSQLLSPFWTWATSLWPGTFYRWELTTIFVDSSMSAPYRILPSIMSLCRLPPMSALGSLNPALRNA